MINWPPSLVRELAARRCIFFLGAGVSASASDNSGKRPCTWAEFLKLASELIIIAPHRESVYKLIEEKNYLLALQGIKDHVNQADYRDLLDAQFNNPAFQPGELHKLINEIDARIVITTNFDRIYERYCFSVANQEAFKIISYYSGDLCDELRSDVRLIVKAHGSIDEIGRMIFTRGEYHRAKREHGNFYEILKAIFLTHTVVFIGCGLQDPDVLLLLEDVRVLGSAQRPHYAVTCAGEHSSFVIADWRSTYNVVALEYDQNHDALIEDMRALAEAVDDERLKTGMA